MFTNRDYQVCTSTNPGNGRKQGWHHLTHQHWGAFVVSNFVFNLTESWVLSSQCGAFSFYYFQIVDFPGRPPHLRNIQVLQLQRANMKVQDPRTFGPTLGFRLDPRNGRIMIVYFCTWRGEFIISNK